MNLRLDMLESSRHGLLIGLMLCACSTPGADVGPADTSSGTGIDGTTGDGDGDSGDGDSGDGDSGDGDSGDGDSGDGDGDVGLACELARDDDACLGCAKETCCVEWAACLADEVCMCLHECAQDEEHDGDCGSACGLPSVITLALIPLYMCFAVHCDDVC